MKKIIQMGGNPLGGIPLLIFLLISTFAFGQSVTILPQNTTSRATSGNNIRIQDNTNDIGIRNIRFNGTLASPTPVTSGQNLLNLIGAGFYSTGGTSDQVNIRFTATENWNSIASGAKMSFWTTPNGSFTQAERMTINHDGKIGIGISATTKNLHVHESTASIGTSVQITNADAGTTNNDGLHIGLNPSSLFFSLGASIINKENSYLALGANNNDSQLYLNSDGKIGLGTISPNANLHIFGGSSGVTPNPGSVLFVEKNASNYLGLASPNADESGILFGKPALGAGAAGIIYNTANTMEFRTGGNNMRMSISNAGFIRLGDDATAPPIKTKVLTGTTSATAGGTVFSAHGITQSKILSVSIFVTNSVNDDIPPHHDIAGASYYSFYLTSTNLAILNGATATIGGILNKPFRALITYRE